MPGTLKCKYILADLMPSRHATQGQTQETAFSSTALEPSSSRPDLCFAGYMFTYYNSKVTEERKARIERINEQVAFSPAEPCRDTCCNTNLLWVSVCLLGVSGCAYFSDVPPKALA
jgi:hypothetical protein